MSIIETKDGVIISVFIKPNSSKFNIEISDAEIVVNCTEEPVKGKVNKEILKEFSKILHAKVEIASGFSSNKKKLYAKGIRKNQAEQLLKSI